MSFIENTQTTRNEEEQACLFAMKLATAHTLPMVLKSAIELELLEIIAKAGEGQFISAKEIAAQIPSKNVDAPLILDRILRFLASYSVLKCKVRETRGVVERFYGAAPVVKYLTRNEDGGSLAAYMLFGQDKIAMESWYYLKDAVLEGGIPFDKAYGMNRFEYHENDQRSSNKFNDAMSDHSIFTMKKILETYTGFKGIRSLVDVGGGVGTTLNMIISKYPSITGINFDLPHVLKEAPTFSGLEHVGGDMFLSVPKGDAIFMKFIFHNWSDENCLKFLQNCYDALPQNGKVIIAEYISPEYPDTSMETKNIVDMDMIMFKNFLGGKERTAKEFETLAKSVGFLGFLVMCTNSCISVMEFLKNI